MDELNQRPGVPSAAVYRFGLFALDVSACSLTRNGLRIKLQDQPFQLLALLLENFGEIVTREEIRLRLWQSNTFVDFDKSLGVAVVKVREALGDNAANPRFLETVPRRGYRFIAPVSVEANAWDSASAAGLSRNEVPAVAAMPHPTETVQPEPRASHEPSPVPGRKWRFLYMALTLCAMMALALTWFWPRFHPREAATPEQPLTAQVKLRRSVAVLGFRNVSAGSEQKWLSTAFTEMLNTELAANGDLRLVSGEDVANVKHDLALQDEDTLAKATLTRLRASLDADVVVAGSYTLLNDGGKNRIRLDIRAQDTALGETIFEDAITGSENDLFDIASQAGVRIRESLHPSVSLAPASDNLKMEGSTNPLALQFYSEGLSRLYQFDFVGARDVLKRAVTADPAFAAAHSALSNTFAHLGDEAQARAEAKSALQHARDLPQETVLAIQGQYQESIGDWPNSVLTYQKLFELFPDNLKYGLQLAGAQLHVSPADARRTLTVLRALPSPLSDDPRIDLMEATVLIGQDMPKARAAAQRAIAKASAQRASLMVARGYGILCEQDTTGGESMEQSIAECTLARNSYISAGDENNAARTLTDFAGLYFEQGDLLKAQAMWEQAIEVFRRLKETEGLAATSNNLGDVLLTTGKLDGASKLLKQAIDGYKVIGDRTGVALATADLGQIALERANLPEAQRDDEQAIAIAIQAGDKSSAAYGFAGLGDVLMQRDQLPAARRQYGTAMSIRKEVGEKQSILQTRIALAQLAIEEGNAANAEKEARQCMSELHQQRYADDELDAGLVLLNAQLSQSKLPDAKQEVDALRPLESKTQSRISHLRFALANARLSLAEDDWRTSKTLLESVTREAEGSEFVVLALEAQKMRALAQREAGDVSGATRELTQVEARQRSAGLLLSARQTDIAIRLGAHP